MAEFFGRERTVITKHIRNIFAEQEKTIDSFVRTSLPPVEGIFYDGQIFDAMFATTKTSTTVF